MNDNEIKKLIIANKRKLWMNTQYDAIVDVRLAKKLGDGAMEQDALKRCKQCEVALAELDAIIEELYPSSEVA